MRIIVPTDEMTGNCFSDVKIFNLKVNGVNSRFEPHLLAQSDEEAAG
jgi:hypothetical protein